MGTMQLSFGLQKNFGRRLLKSYKCMESTICVHGKAIRSSEVHTDNGAAHYYSSVTGVGHDSSATPPSPTIGQSGTPKSKGATNTVTDAQSVTDDFGDKRGQGLILSVQGKSVEGTTPPAPSRPHHVHVRKHAQLSPEAREKLMDQYAGFNPTPMTIKQFLEFGKSLITNGQEMSKKTSFQFLRRELLVRLANITKEIQLLPESLLEQPSTRIVQRWYEQSFLEVLAYDTADADDANTVNKFTADLKKIRDRHAAVVQTMAQGVNELKKSKEEQGSIVDSAMRNSIQYFLDRFYMMRISIRMLINQHTILFGGETPYSARHVGTIDPECDIQAVVDDAYVNARSLCETYYEKAPELRIQCINTVEEEKGNSAKIVYVPSHLFHISFELFKNSMRALCERTGEIDTPPPIQVIIVKSAEDVAIKFSDVGGGISQKHMPRLFEYTFSTAPAIVGNDNDNSGTTVNLVPMAGYGYGLPLSRLYARYFHGDLQIFSMHGYGTDAIIYLKTLSENASELLPVFNKSVLRHYKTSRAHGWSSSSKFAQPVEWG